MVGKLGSLPSRIFGYPGICGVFPPDAGFAFTAILLNQAASGSVDSREVVFQFSRLWLMCPSQRKMLC